ncbi:MAG: 16S rRNA (adenine(1518)-N(6)/adenine(1519)-N(6))-dimethyltransferase RsmA [Patescibacteria group bacterium]
MPEVREFLRRNGIRLNTDLGQHFLIDEEVLRSIVEAAGIEPTDHVVEIGPGIGVLTAELLKRAAKVTAIELDERMIPLLRSFVTSSLSPASNHSAIQPFKNLTIINGNALHVPLPKHPYRIVANIPYHITSPLLRHVFLESSVHPDSLTLLIQREVAEKICDDEDRGLLTILVGLFGKPRIIRNVPPGCFLPPPAVDSAVLQIDCFDAPLADLETIEEVFRMVKIGFGQKRKMLRNTFGPFPELMERLSSLGIDEKRRPQTLSVEEWIALAHAQRKN